MCDGTRSLLFWVFLRWSAEFQIWTRFSTTITYELAGLFNGQVYNTSPKSAEAAFLLILTWNVVNLSHYCKKRRRLVEKRSQASRSFKKLNKHNKIFTSPLLVHFFGIYEKGWLDELPCCIIPKLSFLNYEIRRNRQNIGSNSWFGMYRIKTL